MHIRSIMANMESITVTMDMGLMEKTAQRMPQNKLVAVYG
jgi:hypothetical protein